MYNEVFYKSNLGLGPHPCLPYSYEAFIIATRYFPSFGSEYKTHMPNGQEIPQKYTRDETNKDSFLIKRSKANIKL